MVDVVVSNSIEQLRVVDLVPYARNSRTHSEEQVVQIAASIREFGFTNPVLVVRRWQEFSGRAATRERDGAQFDNLVGA